MVLLAVLLASIGVAYLLVHRQSVPARRGAEIIRQIRAVGLQFAWGTEPTKLTYFARDQRGQVRAILDISRQPVDTGYAGIVIMRSDEGESLEQWSISADAGKCVYAGPTRLDGFSTTRIVLSGDEVSVVRIGRGGAEAATATVPDNYIPEGLMHLVIAHVAGGGKHASFRSILNSEAIVANKVQFATVHMRPQKPDQIAVTWSGMHMRRKELYHLDQHGMVVRFDKLDGALTFQLEKPDGESWKLKNNTGS